MDQQSVVIQLPAELYDRIRCAAADHHRPIETVMLESLAWLFSDLPTNLDAMLETPGT
jgi:plasmid stability protein